MSKAEAAGCRARTKAPEIKLYRSSLPALCMQEAAPTAFWAFLTLICTLEELRARSKGRMPEKCCVPRMLPGSLFPSLHPTTGKARLSLQGSRAIPGCVMGLWENGPIRPGLCGIRSVQGGREASWPRPAPSVPSQSRGTGLCSHQASPRRCTHNPRTEIFTLAGVILPIL